MDSPPKQPRDVAAGLAARSRRRTRARAQEGRAWRRETFVLPRPEARAKAREWFNRFPKAAYMTEIEFWRELPNDEIEFTIRRLPSAD
jgi:hypothetical protein